MNNWKFAIGIANLLFLCVCVQPLHAHESRTMAATDDQVDGTTYMPIIFSQSPSANVGDSADELDEGFRYGLQAHMLHRHEADRVVAASEEMGFGWLKQQVEWRVFEPTQGTKRYYMLDQLVLSASEQNSGLLFSITHAPDWAREAGFDASVDGPPRDPQLMANFVSDIANRYCGTPLQAIEVWNEPNLAFEWGNREPSATEYVDMLQASYAAIKAVCPSIAVVSAGLAPTGTGLPIAIDDQVYLSQLLDAGMLAHADVIGAHPSGYNVPPSATWQEACDVLDSEDVATFRAPCDTPHRSWSFRSTLEGYRDLLAARQSQKPIWVTEFGWASGGALESGYEYANDNSYLEQSQWSIEAFEMMQEWEWVTGAFLWNLNFRYIDSTTERAQWSIVAPNWSPLPTYTALTDMPKVDAVSPAITVQAASLEATLLTVDPLASSEPIPIPEPVTVVLFGSGLLGLAGYTRRKRRESADS